MPLYEYQCLKCQNVFELILNRTDPQPCKCPKCDGKVTKLFPTGTNYKFNCLGSSKDYEHVQAQAQRKVKSGG